MPNLSFSTTTSKDFYRKLEEDYRDFVADPLSSRHAINCAMTAWHLVEWVYRDIYPTVEKALDKDRLKIFIDDFCEQCPELRYMNDIADGSKHCLLGRNNRNITETFFEGGFSRRFNSRFKLAKFRIKIDQNNTIDFEIAIEKAFQFWTAYFSV